MPRRLPARIASRPEPFPRSFSTSTTTSSYFDPPSSVIDGPSRRLPSVLEDSSEDSFFDSASQYGQSTIGLTASTSRPSTARPSTASGRKSRAGTYSVLGSSEAQSIVCAVSEARGVSPSVGVAFVNVSLGEVVLSQICDNQSYVKTIHKIQMMGPSKIIFMSTACPPTGQSTLFSLVDENIPDAHLDSFDRSAWSETAGLEYIHDLAFEDDIEPIKVAIQGKYYATASFSAVSPRSPSVCKLEMLTSPH